MALGKPAIATPTRLEQRPVADAVSNIRQRIEAIEAALNTTTAIAGTTGNTTSQQISALQQQLAVLTALVNSISGPSGTSGAVDDAMNILATQIFGA